MTFVEWPVSPNHRLAIRGDADPIFFLGYWNNESATRAKFTGDVRDSWCRARSRQ